MNKKVYSFLKDVSPKVNIVAWLEFELAYYNVSLQHVNHYAMGTSLYTLVFYLELIKFILLVYILNWATHWDIWMVVWFYGILTFVGYLISNPFLYK